MGLWSFWRRRAESEQQEIQRSQEKIVRECLRQFLGDTRAAAFTNAEVTALVKGQFFTLEGYMDVDRFMLTDMGISRSKIALILGAQRSESALGGLQWQALTSSVSSGIVCNWWQYVHQQ